MTTTLLFWLLLAVLVFWALGAHNRLVRLRAQVITAFAALESRMGQACTLVSERAALPMGDMPADASDAAPVSSVQALEGLRGASIQYEVALRVARRTPLDATSIAALRTARATLLLSWDRLQRPTDEAWAANQRAWEDNQQATNDVVLVFNQAVSDYNQAIAQFPAVVLAYFFGFRAADHL